MQGMYQSDRYCYLNGMFHQEAVMERLGKENGFGKQFKNIDCSTNHIPIPYASQGSGHGTKPAGLQEAF